MRFHIYSFVLLCLFYAEFTYSAEENRKPFFSFKDIAAGVGMTLLLNAMHESGHVFANYLMGGKLLEMNIGSQSNRSQISYGSLGKIRLTGFNPAAMHVRMARKICENEKTFEQGNIFIDLTGPIAAIAAAGLSLYALNKYGLEEEYPVVRSVCFGILIGNILQLLPFEILGTKSDGAHAYESYKKLHNIK